MSSGASGLQLIKDLWEKAWLSIVHSRRLWRHGIPKISYLRQDASISSDSVSALMTFKLNLILSHESIYIIWIVSATIVKAPKNLSSDIINPKGISVGRQDADTRDNQRCLLKVRCLKTSLCSPRVFREV